jgi:hypothetical protein
MPAADPDYHLVEVPTIIRPGSAPHETCCNYRPEFEDPSTDAFQADTNASLRQQVLNVPQIQGKEHTAKRRGGSRLLETDGR